MYGKQATAEPAPEGNGADETLAKSQPDVTTTSNTLEQKKAAFEELINGEYKDIYTEKFQEVFNRRFKEAKNNENRLQTSPFEKMLFIITVFCEKATVGLAETNKLGK